MTTQAILWHHDLSPTPDLFRPITAAVGHGYRKPHGCGLWTSTFLGLPTISDWAEWCRYNDFACGDHHLWLLDPDPDASVLTVDSFDDLLRAHDKYGVDRFGHGRRSETLDWWRIASDGYDAIHLTEKGQRETHLSHPVDTYGWDCESTLWLRWRFTSVEDGGRWTIRDAYAETAEAPR